MKSGAKPAFLKRGRVYYGVGGGEWKYGDSLETRANEKVTLYLGSDGSAGDIFHSGSLANEKKAGAAADAWIYDPLDTRPGDAENLNEEAFLTSQAPVANLFGEGAIYHSEPFAAATEISGFVKLTVWLEMDGSDTDLEVSLYEILPNGGSVALTGSTMRGRYRRALREEKPVPGVNPEEYGFDYFTFFAPRVSAGSR